MFELNSKRNRHHNPKDSNCNLQGDIQHTKTIFLLVRRQHRLCKPTCERELASKLSHKRSEVGHAEITQKINPALVIPLNLKTQSDSIGIFRSR